MLKLFIAKCSIRNSQQNEHILTRIHTQHDKQTGTFACPDAACSQPLNGSARPAIATATYYQSEATAAHKAFIGARADSISNLEASAIAYPQTISAR